MGLGLSRFDGGAGQVLLAHGRDRGLVNYRGERPADAAKRQGQSKAARLLATDAA